MDDDDDGQATDSGASSISVEADVKISSHNVAMQPAGQQMQGWQTGLLDCHRDHCKAFCWSACLPCVPFVCIADIVDQGSGGCCACACFYCFFYLLSAYLGVWWIYAGWYRGKLRAQYGLPEAPLPDILTHLLCHWCALAQEYRELAVRGYRVMKGWDGRPTPPSAPAKRAPTVQEPMTRASM